MPKVIQLGPKDELVPSMSQPVTPDDELSSNPEVKNATAEAKKQE